MKSVTKGRYKANVGAGSGAGAGAETFLKVGAGAETKSFGSTTLIIGTFSVLQNFRKNTI